MRCENISVRWQDRDGFFLSHCMPYKANEARRHKFSKARYQVKNGREYDQTLQARGSLTLWVTPEALASASGGEARPSPSLLRPGDRDGLLVTPRLCPTVAAGRRPPAFDRDPAQREPRGPRSYRVFPAQYWPVISHNRA